MEIPTDVRNVAAGIGAGAGKAMTAADLCLAIRKARSRDRVYFVPLFIRGVRPGREPKAEPVAM